MKQSKFCTIRLYKISNLKFILFHCRNQKGLQMYKDKSISILKRVSFGFDFFFRSLIYKSWYKIFLNPFVSDIPYMHSSAVCDMKKKLTPYLLSNHIRMRQKYSIFFRFFLWETVQLWTSRIFLVINSFFMKKKLFVKACTQCFLEEKLLEKKLCYMF